VIKSKTANLEALKLISTQEQGSTPGAYWK